MTQYTHIVFDIDGTMLDSAFADLSALQRVIRELQNRECPLEELQFALGIPGHVALKQLGIEEVETANRLWNKYMTELSHTMRLFDGIVETIRTLKSHGLKIGIVTSKNPIEYAHDFSPFGIDALFDTVILVTDSKAPKPSPEPMFAYLEKSNASPEEVLYIGDTRYDRNCAAGAGVDFGLALWGARSPHEIEATYQFHSPHDIIQTVLSI